MRYHITSEQDTRTLLIDPRLQSAGWTLAPYSVGKPLEQYEGCAVREFPTTNGPADYALVLGGRVVGVVEAKKLSLGPQNVLTQAERYARGLRGNGPDYGGLCVPFLYSTNGKVTWFHDVRRRMNRSREVAGFHTPGAMREMLARDFQADCATLQNMPNDHTRLRPYQREANAAVEAAIEAGKRQMLIAMATGTGKTFTMVNQAYRLMKSGVAQRILFLVDRRALAAQAVQAFAAFEAEPAKKFDKIYEVYSQRLQRGDTGGEFDVSVMPERYLTLPDGGDAFLYVCTIQRMAMNLFGGAAALALVDEPLDEDARKLDIPIHAFDLIIADECHRGYTSQQISTWRNTLEHFDAIKIGLTATPAAHTTAYFHDIVFRYGYEQAVAEGYLVDYDAVRISSDVRMNGVFLAEGERVDVIDPETGARGSDQLEDERKFDAADVERRITSPDSNRKILEEVKRCADEHQERFGRMPKILIYAVNDIPHISHADQLVAIARDVFGRGDDFVQKITGSPTVDKPLQRIREFRNRPEPGVVVTVDMLTTGVDIPDLEFLVFLRPVKSRILFEQMLGRGTRKGERFPDKSHFTVFDCFDGTLLEYFRNATGMTAEAPEPPSRSIVDVIEAIWQNKDREYNIRVLVKRFQRIDKEMSGEGRDAFAAYIPDGDLAKYAAALTAKLSTDFTGTMKLLRNPDFQDLLAHYPRPKPEFTITYQEDTVTSEYLIRDRKGKEYRVEDYLESFARFVRDNPEQIGGIRVLLDRPQEWNALALVELREKMDATPQTFTETNLRMAHEIRYHKAAVDIISMVQHAAREAAPLLNTSERVSRAFERVTAGKTFTHEQNQWLERIRQHLEATLSLDEGDFSDAFIFLRAGGRTQARRVLGDLQVISREFNEALAA